MVESFRLMKHMFETSIYQFQECCWFQGRQWEAKEVSNIKGVVVHRAWYLGDTKMLPQQLWLSAQNRESSKP